MSTKYTQLITRSCLKYIKRILLTVAVLVVLAAGVAAECGRRTFHHSTTLYGGRQFDTFVSCESSAGNFAYTCAEGGGCYVDTSVDANYECRCSNEQMITQ